MLKRLYTHRSVLFGVVISTVVAIAAYASSGESPLVGTWVNNRAKIVIDPGDTLRINLKFLPEKSGVYNYQIVPIGEMNLIKYSVNTALGAEQQFLLMADKTDTTAIIAYGVPFIRVSGGKGILGTWKNIRNLSEIRWDIGVDFIEYSETALDVKTGFWITKEKHRGTYIAEKDAKTGRFLINFDDGASAVIFPVVFKKIIYIFDMTPRRALFSAPKETPVADSLKTGAMAVNDTTVKK